MFLSVISIFTFAQADTETQKEELQTLMGKDSRLGGYAAFSMATSNQLDQAVFLKAGGYAAAVFNHRLSIGVGGFGYSNDLSMVYPDSGHYLEGGYGGLLIEPILFPAKPIHVTFPILIGAGTSSFNDEIFGNYGTYRRNYENYLFAEPAVNVELSLTKFMRFGVTARYMMTTPISNEEHENALTGLNYGFNLKIGWF